MTTRTAKEPIPEKPAPGGGVAPEEDDAFTADAGMNEGHAQRVGETGTRTDAPADSEAEPGSPAEGEAKPFYSRLEDFVDGHFVPLVRRPLGGEFRWCAQWWRHAEAISRLTAIWHAWEALRRQPGTGIGLWYRDHLDHQLPHLLGPRGPFFQCSEDEHIEPRRLKSEPAPPDWWP